MTMPRPRATLLARVYERIYRHADLPFVQRCLERTRGMHLALGCGTGRELTPALQAGRPVVGIDYWDDMLAVARRQLLPQYRNLLRLECADFVECALPRDIGLITCLSNTWPMMLSTSVRAAMWRRCFDSLARGGLMLVVITHRYPPGVTERHIDIETEDGHLDFQIRWQEDITAARRTYRLDLRLHDEHESHTIPTAMIPPTEMVDGAQAVGFRVDAAYGDYDSSPLIDHSPWQVFILAKDSAL